MPLRTTVLVVALGGALGALLRHLVPGDAAPASIPWSTMAVNVGGSLLLGSLTGVALSRDLPAWVRPFLGTGVLGGFTTFSTFAVDAAQRAAGHADVAAAYAALTTVGAATAAMAGLLLGKAAARGEQP